MTFNRSLAGFLEVNVTRKSSQDIPQNYWGVKMTKKKGMTFHWPSTVKVTTSVQSIGVMGKGVFFDWMSTVLFLLVSYLIIES